MRRARCDGCGSIGRASCGDGLVQQGWRMTKHICPVWICSACVSGWQHQNTLAPPGYWSETDLDDGFIDCVHGGPNEQCAVCAEEA